MNQTVEPPPETSAPPRLGLALRLLIIAGGALLIWLAVGRLGDALWGVEMSLAKHISNSVAVFVLAVPLVIVIRRRIDRRPVSTLGLDGAATAWRGLLLGLATWLIPAAVGLTACVSLGWLQIRLESSLAQLFGTILLLAVLVLVYEAFPEELIFRGYIFTNLAANIAPWLAIVVQAVVFSLWGTTMWVVNEGWGVLADRMVLFFAMAFVIGCIRLISRTVWAGIGFHIGFQVTMQVFLSTQYVDMTVSDEDLFSLATAVLAFCTSSAIAGLLWRHKHNWRAPEPDTAPQPTRTG